MPCTTESTCASTCPSMAAQGPEALHSYSEAATAPSLSLITVLLLQVPWLSGVLLFFGPRQGDVTHSFAAGHDLRALLRPGPLLSISTACSALLPLDQPIDRSRHRSGGGALWILLARACILEGDGC